MKPESQHPVLSVVVPVYNEERNLEELHRRLSQTCRSLQVDFEIVFVNDGSRDGSQRILEQLRAADASVGVIKFSRNFGKESAMSAGLQAARGDAVIVMDADLQHPPEAIPEMVAAWRDRGVDLVNMRRRSRSTESWVKRSAAGVFYRLINRLSDVAIPENVGDFRLLSRRAVRAINQLGERNRFMKGLFAWIGYQQATLEFDVEERFAGASAWNLLKLGNFAVDGLVAFSVRPLRLASYAGMLSSLGAFLYGVYFLVVTLLFGDPVPGFPTLIVTILFIGGLQLMAIGILGEYIGRLFVENKQRPLYIIEEFLPSHHGMADTAATRDLR